MNGFLKYHFIYSFSNVKQKSGTKKLPNSSQLKVKVIESPSNMCYHEISRGMKGAKMDATHFQEVITIG